MKIFLTGGSGFVGGAFIKAARETHDIIAMSRSQTSDAKIKALGVTPVRCSLGSVEPEDLIGCQVVLHCAAYVEEWGPWATYRKINVEGTRQLIKTAKLAGVKRFIHISSEAALFHGQHMRQVDETYPLALNSPFPYSRTKAEAEVVVREASQGEESIETIILRPRMIWGPGDETVLKVVAEMAANGKFAWIDQGRAQTSSTHIQNLVHAINLALTKGKSGEAYFVLDDKDTTMREFLTSYLATQGVNLGEKSVPGWLARTLSNIFEPAWRGLNLKSAPPLTRFTAHIMSRDCTLIDTKAQNQLGYAPVMSRDAGFSALSAN